MLSGALDRFKLTGRVAVVTGGASSLGRVLATGLAEAGAAVVVASRDLAACEDVAKNLREQGGTAHALALDLSDQGSIDRLATAVSERFGRLDILVNNAVARFPGHVESLSKESWDASLEIDATGFFLVTQRCLRDMADAGRGVIVNIASGLGERSAVPELYPDGLTSLRPAFFFAKAGMINFTRFLAVAYGRKGIRANCLSPGYNMPAADYEPVGGKALDLEKLASRVPMGRLGALDEYKGAVIFLASDASSYLTGQNIVVDGGYSAW